MIKEKYDDRSWAARYWWVIAILGIAAIFFMVTGPMSFYTVPAGYAATEFDPLNGGVQPYSQGEGLHTKAFWVSVDNYNLKQQEYTMAAPNEKNPAFKPDEPSIRAVAADGLYITVDVTTQFKVNPVKLATLRQTIGTDKEYQQIVVIPTIRSQIRKVISQHTAADVYGENRSNIEPEIEKALQGAIDSFAPNVITINQVQLRDVGLPEELVASITAKKQAEQDAQRMEFVLQKQKLEAQRVVIEAQGIRDSQDIVQQTLTPAYLHYLWLQKLSEHNNVIYVPTEGNFPMFKDIDESNTPPTKIKDAPAAVIPAPSK